MSRDGTSRGNVYGRQGGGWTQSTGRAADAIAAIARLRAEGKKAGTWPKHEAAGTTPFRRPNDRDEGYTWDGAARMARARLDAGVPLTPIDHEALRRQEE